MNTLVLGATGHLGQAVVRELLARGYRVTGATRQTAPSNLIDLDVRIATGNDERPGQLDEWVKGHDLVVDAAAPYPLGMFAFDPRRRQAVLESARVRTRALLEAVLHHRARLAFVSSFTTLRRPPESGLTTVEAELRRLIYPYFAAKEAMERMVLAAAGRGLPAVVVNPTACLGPWDARNSMSSWVHCALTGRFPVVTRDVANVVDVRDVASGLLRAIDERCYGEPIALSGHNIALVELLERLCELGGVPAPPLCADARTVAVFAFWMETACALMGQPAPLAVGAAPLLADAWPMDIGATQRALGAHPRPLEQTLRAAVSWQQSGYPV
jgi:nucleoside-diphosphate-sugar epimerase